MRFGNPRHVGAKRVAVAMKIVSVMTTSSRGGAEFAAVEMLDALSARGHEVVMLSDQPDIARDTRVQVRPIAIGPKLSLGTYASLAMRTPVLLQRLNRALRREAPYAVLLVHYKKEQLLAALLPARLQATLVWTEWGPVPFPMRHGVPRWLYLGAARSSRAIIAVAGATKRNLVEVGIPEDKVTYVPNVLRTDEIHFTHEGRIRVRERLGIPPEAFVVGCLSRFHPKKRNDVVIRATALLGSDSVHLILAGEGETEGELRALAGSLNATAHFMSTPGSDVADVLSAFDVSVFCPSPTEGQPRAVILGMLARRPCVSTGAEGVADLIQVERGTIVRPENDSDALARVLQRYLEDPERRRREGEAGRRWAEETFAGPIVAEQLEALLHAAGAVG
jgi:glycosyltransferase involved in cell wall biosynthesis